jgi:PilZ domain-containing protein
MSTSPVCHERRAAQRFDYQLPISIKVIGIEGEVHGCTQDLSARGAFFYTEAPLTEGSEVEVTLLMPAEITLTASMPVRCRGKVLRVARQEGSTKIGVAVQLAGYEFLPETQNTRAEGSFGRIASLHDSVFSS